MGVGGGAPEVPLASFLQPRSHMHVEMDCGPVGPPRPLTHAAGSTGRGGGGGRDRPPPSGGPGPAGTPPGCINRSRTPRRGRVYPREGDRRAAGGIIGPAEGLSWGPSIPTRRESHLLRGMKRQLTPDGQSHVERGVPAGQCAGAAAGTPLQHHSSVPRRDLLFLCHRRAHFVTGVWGSGGSGRVGSGRISPKRPHLESGSNSTCRARR